MSTTFFAIAIATAIGGDPAISNGGYYGATETPGAMNYPMANGPVTNGGVTGGIFGDDLYPYDSQHPWQHGYFQEISPYSGYHFFRPYNYRNVLSQTQVAAGWGITPQLAYSQHFWNRYQEQAAWKNYALPRREEDLEKIQRQKEANQRRTSYYQQQPAMVPVQYQQQYQNPYQQQQFQPQQQFQQQPIQIQNPVIAPEFNQAPRYQQQ